MIGWFDWLIWRVIDEQRWQWRCISLGTSLNSHINHSQNQPPHWPKTWNLYSHSYIISILMPKGIDSENHALVKIFLSFSRLVWICFRVPWRVAFFHPIFSSTSRRVKWLYGLRTGHPGGCSRCCLWNWLGEMAPRWRLCVWKGVKLLQTILCIYIYILYTYYTCFIQVEAKFCMTSSNKICLKISDHPPEMPWHFHDLCWWMIAKFPIINIFWNALTRWTSRI